jgi:LytR cell envelope-related transcriptional attenuator/LytR_cpsA_psr family
MSPRRRGRHAIGAPVEEPDLEEHIDEVEEAEDSAGPEETELETQNAGARRVALQRRRRFKALKRVLIGVGIGALAVGLAVGLPYFLTTRADKEESRSKKEDVTLGGRGAFTLLVFGTREHSSDPRADWFTLFSFDGRSETGTAMSIPAHTAAEVPGHGLQPLEAAYTGGGIPLLLVTVENLLGIEVDRYLELSDRDAFVLFRRLTPVTVTVPEEVRVLAGRKQTRVVFVAGAQELRARSLARLLYVRGLEVDDIDLGSRHLAIWDGLFDRFENDPRGLARAIRASDAVLGESDANGEEIARFFERLAELPRASFHLVSLPVQPVAAGDDELYSTDAEELQGFVTANLPGADRGAAQTRLQILNGNGEPGIGKEVAGRLVGEGFRVILSGNARRFDYERTLIVTYDSSDKGLALAERAKRLLGVGEVQISVQRQGIVDLTIVVGKDFLRTL